MDPLRRAFTLIEIIMVMALIGIVAGWSITKFRASGYRMDSNIRMLQNALIGAQQTAITRNVVVCLMFDSNLNRVRIHQDSDDDGSCGLDPSETASYRPLFDGARFITPDLTVDGALPYYLTGSNFHELTPTQRAIRIAPNGSLPGDAVIYVGTILSRPDDLRALTIVGATTRTGFWSLSGGTWRQRSY